MDFTKLLNIVIRAAVAQVTRILVNSAAGLFRRGMRGMPSGRSSGQPGPSVLPPTPPASPEDPQAEARRMRRDAAIARRSTRGG